LYRINGIRELFEETGILLCRTIQSLTENNELIYPVFASTINISDFNITTNELMDIRKDILKDASKFEEFLRKYKLVPDILSMVPWARIQTPWILTRNGKPFRRWDARFYLCLSKKSSMNPSKDILTPLGHEIAKILWIPMNLILSKSIQATIPAITMVKCIELYNICIKEKCLLHEWKTSFKNRNVRVIRPKIFYMDSSKRNPITLFPGDYLYDKCDNGDTIDLDLSKENDPQQLRRGYLIYKSQLNTLLNNQGRLYNYNKSILYSKL